MATPPHTPQSEVRGGGGGGGVGGGGGNLPQMPHPGFAIE